MDDKPSSLKEETPVDPAIEAFKKFMGQLSSEINKALNPSGELRVGFALIVYPAGATNEATTVVSNTENELVTKAMRAYLNRKSKRTRRTTLKKVK